MTRGWAETAFWAVLLAFCFAGSWKTCKFTIAGQPYGCEGEKNQDHGCGGGCK
jgi:hypothetical protein